MTTPHTVQVDPGRPPATHAVGLGPEARDIDVSAESFRLLVIGGGSSGLVTVMCAASLAHNGNSLSTWLWQLVSGVVFLWFATSAKGMLRSRGFLVDRYGFYARTQGEIFGVSWSEISAIGIGSLPWVQGRRPVHPLRRQAIEFYAADPGFVSRHPELERWRVDEPATVPGLPNFRYRFFLPPLSRVPRQMERAVTELTGRKWIGRYRRALPAR